MSEPHAGPPSPWWVTLLTNASATAVLAFLVLYLLGAIPMLPSPIDKIYDRLTAHERTTDALLKASQQTCRGVWELARNPQMAEQCGR